MHFLKEKLLFLIDWIFIKQFSKKIIDLENFYSTILKKVWN